MTSALVCLWLKISICTRVLYFPLSETPQSPSVTLSICNRMKVLIKVVCCVAPSLAQPWRATMGICYLIGCLPTAQEEREGREGGRCSPSVPLCSTESVPDGCDLWTSQNGGTNERYSTCVRDGGTVFGHQSVFEEGSQTLHHKYKWMVKAL